MTAPTAAAGGLVMIQASRILYTAFFVLDQLK